MMPVAFPLCDAHTHWHEVSRTVSGETAAQAEVRESDACTAGQGGVTSIGKGDASVADVSKDLSTAPVDASAPDVARHNDIHGHGTPCTVSDEVDIIVVCGCSPDDWPAAEAFASTSSRVSTGVPESVTATYEPLAASTTPLPVSDPDKIRYACLGVHPWWSAPFGDEAALARVLEQLKDKLLASPRMAVGEIGLDKGKRGLSSAPFETQQAVFQAQLALAGELSRVVCIHCVRAHEEVAAALVACAKSGGSKHPAGVLLHSWPGPPHATNLIRDKLDAAGIPLVFSFQGTIVNAVIAAMQEVHQKAAAACVYAASAVPDGAAHTSDASGPIDPPLPTITIAPHTCASKQTMAVVASLSLTHIVFETDAPYQEFVTDDPSWVRWKSQVLGALDMSIDGSNTAHTPDKVLDVMLAAATWRVSKDRPSGKPTRPIAHSADAADVAKELVTLAHAAYGNLRRVFERRREETGE